MIVVSKLTLFYRRIENGTIVWKFEGVYSQQQACNSSSCESASSYLQINEISLPFWFHRRVRVILIFYWTLSKAMKEQFYFSVSAGLYRSVKKGGWGLVEKRPHLNEGIISTRQFWVFVSRRCGSYPKPSSNSY